MKLIFKIFLMVGLFMLFSTISFGGEVHDVVTYWGYTEEYETVTWDPVQDDPVTDSLLCVANDDPWECCTSAGLGNCVEDTAEYYNIKMMHIEQNVEIARGRVDHPGVQAAVVFPRSGHYKLMVNACRMVGDPAVEECSEWAESTDPTYATYNGQPKGWWVYRHISPPVIE